MSATIATLAIVVGAILYVQVGDQGSQQADAQLARHVENVSGRLELLLVQASRDIRLARRNAALEEVMAKRSVDLTPEDYGRVDAALGYISERYAVDETCLILANGHELGRWVQGALAPVAVLSSTELANNPALVPTLAQADDTAYMATPDVSPDTARWVVAFATPVVLADGVTAGVLHFEIPTQSFADELAGAQFGAADYSFLMDRDGRLLAHPDIAAFRRASGLPIDPSDSAFPAANAMGTSTWKAAVDAARLAPAREASFEDHVTQYRLVTRSVPGSPWIVATAIPTTELYASVERAHLNLAITIGPLILLMVLISAWFSRRLTRTNGRLATASRASSQLAAIVESADDAILSVEPDGEIATWNLAAAEMYQLSAEAALGAPLAQLFRQDRQAEVSRLLAVVMAGEAIERHETVLRRTDDSTFDAWLTLSPIRDAENAVVPVSVVSRDVSDRKRLEEELPHQALHDALTGLPNRVLFQDRLRQSLQRARGPERPATGRHGVLFIDLDDFKVINDTLGHRIGDELLVAVAARLEDSLRAGDTAARLGGDEFTVLLENIHGPKDAEAATDRILDYLRRPFELDGHQIVVSASIGIALGEPASDDPDDLLRAADTALYEAKGHGKGRHETFQETMKVRAWRRLELEGQLRRAIADQQLRVHYQPIVDMATGAIVHVEALVRWEHPELGLVAPGEFLPLAEQTGLIVSIGKFVRTTACRQLAEWRRTLPSAKHLGLSVNASPRELAASGFVDGIARLLSKHGLRGDALIVEITENATLEGETAVGALRVLRERGIRVWIDDFGTGYSSLGYFRDLPIDGLKIDRLFVDGLGHHPAQTAIVTAALAFASALELEVVGEGVETAEQSDSLQALGCRLGQGFHFSRAIDAIEMSVVLAGLPAVEASVDPADAA